MTDEVVPEGGELRAEILAMNDELKVDEVEKAVQVSEEQQAERARIPADKSSFTRWAQPSKRQGAGTLWHGFSYAGAYKTVSYCGVEHFGSFRRSPPPRDNAVCVRCASACGFVRRSRRVKGERQRGSRRLGTIVDRMEVAMDGIERALAEVREALSK